MSKGLKIIIKSTVGPTTIIAAAIITLTMDHSIMNIVNGMFMNSTTAASKIAAIATDQGSRIAISNKLTTTNTTTISGVITKPRMRLFQRSALHYHIV